MINQGGCIHYGTFWTFAPVGILTQRPAQVHLRGFKPAPSAQCFCAGGDFNPAPSA